MAISANTPKPVAVTTTYSDFSARSKSNKTLAQRGSQVFLFDRSNWMWMAAGLVLILLGMLLMAGGKSANPHEFHPEIVYSARRITLAPIVMLLGFAIEAYAIMKKPAALRNTETSVAVEPAAV